MTVTVAHEAPHLAHLVAEDHGLPQLSHWASCRSGAALWLSHTADAPPMTGGEYLTPDVLEQLWADLLATFRTEISGSTGTVQALLAGKNAAWNVVGKVHFHLAENKGSPDRPFAFLASYTTGLSAHGKPQHRPLGDAVRESARDKSRLLALRATVAEVASPPT